MNPEKSWSKKTAACGAIIFFFALAFQVIFIRFILENLRP
jgi:hypothetical protein